MVSVGVNYHPTRHTSTIRLVDYVFCYLFPDDLVNFLPRFYAFTKRDKIAIKMGGNFKCCFNYFWIGVRSDFDRFWPTFTWIYKTESSVGVVVGRTRKKITKNKTRRQKKKKKRNQIFRFTTTGTDGNPARPSGRWNIVARARTSGKWGDQIDIVFPHHYGFFNSSPRPQLLCAPVPLGNNNRLKCNVKMNRL